MVALSPVLALPAPLAVGISPVAANGLALAFTSAFVGSLYVAQHLFGESPDPSSAEYPPPGHRDHPRTIQLRTKAVSLATRSCLTAVMLLIRKLGNYSLKQAWLASLRLMGLSTIAYTQPLAYLVTPLLFLGPHYGYYLDGVLPGQSNFDGITFGPIEQRNYFMGPLTEELLFRSAIISVSVLGGLSWKQIVFGTPLWFGLAHVHHAFQVFREQGSTRAAAKRAVIGATFQMGYTTLFGWIASYLYVRTGSVLPSFLAHTFCNLMGLPAIGQSLADHPTKKISIWAAYLAGIGGFAYFIGKV